MPKFQIEANEILDPNVNLVSLVKRGANRLPFRITKSEDNNDMIDLAKLGQQMFRKGDTVTGPTIAAVLIAKSDRTDAIVKTLTEAGFPMDKLAKSDGTGQVNFAKADLDKVVKEETVLIKMSEDVAIVVQGESELMKSLSLYDWESTSFSEIMTKGAFCPSVSIAQDMLNRTFYNIMEKAESPAELSTLMKGAVNDFNSYVTTLAKALPSTVFKADTALRKEEIASNPLYGNQPVADARAKNLGGETSNDIEGSPVAGNPKGKTGETDIKGTVSNDIEGSPVAGASKGGTTVVKEDEKKEGEGSEKKDTKTVEEGGTKTTETHEVKKEEAADPVLTAIKAMQNELNASIAAVRTDVDAKFGAVTKTVDSLATQVKKTDEAVNGTVGAHAESDRTGITKTEGNDNRTPPLLDTAYTRVDEEEDFRERQRRARA
jgi:hypothetical protein